MLLDVQGWKRKGCRNVNWFQPLSSMDVSRLEQRLYVKIAVLRDQNAREYQAQLLEAVGDDALPYRTVAKWLAVFQGE